MVSTNREAQVLQVNKVLQEIGASNVRQVLVLNQIDRCESYGLDTTAGFERDEYGKIYIVRVSAKTGVGLEFIKLALTEHQQYLKQLSTEESAYA